MVRTPGLGGVAAWAHAANVAAVAHAVAKFAAAKFAAAKLFAAANLPAAKSQFDAANLHAAKFAAVVLVANVSSQKRQYCGSCTLAEDWASLIAPDDEADEPAEATGGAAVVPFSMRHPKNKEMKGTRSTRSTTDPTLSNAHYTLSNAHSCTKQ